MPLEGEASLAALQVKVGVLSLVAVPLLGELKVG
jgi:hypothetical protein